MREDFRATLSYRKGYLALTDTHLMVVRDDTVANSWMLCHLSGLEAEQAHTFRHRLGGLLAAAVLLAPATSLLLPGDLANSLALLALFRGRLGVGVFFAAFFGLLILWEVARSRRIWWLRARYLTMQKVVPLPDVDPDTLERFVQLLDPSTEERSSHNMRSPSARTE